MNGASSGRAARSDTSVRGGLAERLRARGAVRGLVLTLRQVAMAAAGGDFDGARRLSRITGSTWR